MDIPGLSPRCGVGNAQPVIQSETIRCALDHGAALKFEPATAGRLHCLDSAVPDGDE
jgi:hypothetical protein